MKRRGKLTLAGLAIVVLVIAVFAYLKREYIEELPLACAFKAKTLCAGIFVQGLPQATLEAEDSGFDGAFPLVHARVDEAKKSVTCSLLGTGLFAKTAMVIEGLGPVLLSGTSEAKLRAIAASAPARVGASDAVAAAGRELKPWPEGEAAGQVAGAKVGGVTRVDSAALGAAIDSAFAETDKAKLKRTRAIVVVHGGRIVAERYAQGITKDTRLVSWSMAKSFTNAMIGILVRQGKLDIRAPAPVGEWSRPGDPRAGITTNMLMRMSSGLEWYEDYTDHPISDVNRMLFLESDAAAYTARKKLAAAPDTVWSYSSGTTNIVSRIARDAIGNEGEYLAFPYRELFGKIGMESAVFGTDGAGIFVGSSYLYATARDFARFGLLCLHDGVWEGERILPEKWMAYSTTPTKGAPKGEYGAFFWLNRGSPGNPSDRAFPGMPEDLYIADGYQGQEIYICPSLDLVAVRLGMTWDGAWGEAAFLEGVRKAIGR
jgi:CubicO group peptidase (beta-lactamase class C family)